jgi:hypothetical protein
MKKTLVLLLLLISISTFSQFKITGYFDAEIGVSYQFSDKFQTGLRANDDLGREFNTELSLLYKFLNKEDYNLNVGLGVNSFLFSGTDIIESIFIPLQIEIIPFKELRNFGLVIESAYHFSDLESGIRNSIGLRYIFK